MKVKLTTIVAVTAILAGCQSTDSASNNTVFKCKSGDYQALGYDVGTAGLSVREFNRYTAECGEQLPENAKKNYITGFKKGIAEYCNFDNGYKLGLEGVTDASKCPLELRENFKSGINSGLAENRRQENLKKELDRQERDKQLLRGGSNGQSTPGGAGG